MFVHMVAPPPPKKDQTHQQPGNGDLNTILSKEKGGGSGFQRKRQFKGR